MNKMIAQIELEPKLIKKQSDLLAQMKENIQKEKELIQNMIFECKKYNNTRNQDAVVLQKQLYQLLNDLNNIYTKRENFTTLVLF